MGLRNDGTHGLDVRRYRVTSVQVSGTEGYADEAEDLFRRYEGIPVADAHRAVLHPSPQIEWLNDSLPELTLVRTRGGRFDLVMLTAVWMHLDAQQRQRAMPNLAALVREGGTVVMKIRHGPVPAGRRMFEITPEETIRLARMQGLHPVVNLRTQSSQEQNRAAGVDWTNLAFVKANVPAA